MFLTHVLPALALNFIVGLHVFWFDAFNLNDPSASPSSIFKAVYFTLAVAFTNLSYFVWLFVYILSNANGNIIAVYTKTNALFEYFNKFELERQEKEKSEKEDVKKNSKKQPKIFKELEKALGGGDDDEDDSETTPVVTSKSKSKTPVGSSLKKSAKPKAIVEEINEANEDEEKKSDE